MIEKLKEYRDLIGLVVFFLGGLFWVQNQFPTKTDLSDQLGVVKCQLRSYMSLTQDELHVQDLTGKIQDIDQQLAALSEGTAQTSPSIAGMVEKQRSDRDSYLADLKTTNTQMSDITQSLERQECGK
jgi:methyl-accepting chemotaxis protein